MSIYKNLVNHFGGQVKTAEKLKVSQATVSGWVTGQHGMSAFTALRAEAATSGEFKAFDLCPDLATASSPAA
tara:strand:- start:57529 stop:57744 length:216 start_codon:yes stop_codon:yes gene_type:complete